MNRKYALKARLTKAAALICSTASLVLLTTACGDGGTPAATSAPAPAPTGPLIGVNIHGGGGTALANQKLADLLAARNLKSARMDYLQGGDVAMFRDQVARLAAKGIKVEASLQVSYQWDHSCNQNLTALQSTTYAQTVAMVQAVGDLVYDFELLNEVSLRSEARAQVAPGAGVPASAYAGQSCFASMAAALRGMSSAIVDQRRASGKPYRIILGAVGREFGILEFMRQQGVVFDVVGYHIYPWLNNVPIGDDTYFGPGGALVQLGRFNKPVKINEFNCGEIYATGYENAVGQPLTNACLASVQKHLSGLLEQKVIHLESISAYTLTDSPSDAPPENRFGLLYDLDRPKLHLALYAAFAGGMVTANEKQQLDTLGLKSR